MFAGFKLPMIDWIIAWLLLIEAKMRLIQTKKTKPKPKKTTDVKLYIQEACRLYAWGSPFIVQLISISELCDSGSFFFFFKYQFELIFHIFWCRPATSRHCIALSHPHLIYICSVSFMLFIRSIYLLICHCQTVCSSKREPALIVSDCQTKSVLKLNELKVILKLCFAWLSF